MNKQYQANHQEPVLGLIPRLQLWFRREFQPQPTVAAPSAAPVYAPRLPQTYAQLHSVMGSPTLSYANYANYHSLEKRDLRTGKNAWAQMNVVAMQPEHGARLAPMPRSAFTETATNVFRGASAKQSYQDTLTAPNPVSVLKGPQPKPAAKPAPRATTTQQIELDKAALEQARQQQNESGKQAQHTFVPTPGNSKVLSMEAYLQKKYGKSPQPESTPPVSPTPTTPRPGGF